MSRAQDLILYLIDHPEGVTRDEFVEALGWNGQSRHFAGYVSQARKQLREQGIGWAIVHDPGTKLYAITSDWRNGDRPDIEKWEAARHPDLRAQLENMAHAAAVAVASHPDLRTAAGRRARLMDKQLRRLLEDLDEIAFDS